MSRSPWALPLTGKSAVKALIPATDISNLRRPAESLDLLKKFNLVLDIGFRFIIPAS